ncbi:carbohydrate ABC transporter permease [Pseudarthrobacter sp. YAF2]|uniref:carbohydrate ABC transporter permease n=1 Tax=Pseudarthrobacter sp. YAF2 TaxID=3233078 RepID=UPI003F99C551
MVPVLFLFLGSITTTSQLISEPIALPRPLAFANFSEAWTQANLPLTFSNSVIITVTSVLLSTALAALAAYGLSRFEFATRRAVQVAFLAGLVVPIQLIILPFFVMLRDLHILGTHVSVVLAYTIFNLPLGVLILTPFFALLPRELEEAAWLDGAGRFVTLWRIMLPLMRPALATVVILNGIWIWNDFFVNLVLSTGPNTVTMPVSIMNFYGSYQAEWGLIFAAVTLSIAPVMVAYLFLSKQFIAGLTAGSVKG